MNFDLSEAVENQAGPWPEQPNHPAWPGQPSGNALWPGGNPAPNPAWNPSAPQPSGPGGWFGPSPQPPAPGGWSSPSPAPGPAPGPGPGSWFGPSPAPGPAPGPGPGPGPAGNVSPQQSLTVPYNLNLPGGVHDKLLITIAGTVKPRPDKFTLDFNTSSGDLAFHFNPRFNEQGKKVIVRNTCIGSKWGREERELSHFPFAQGQAFEIKILCTNTEFKVAVNNSHLLEYRHRIRDLRSINRLNIYNDITLSNVKMETMP